MHLYSIYVRSESKNSDFIIIKQGFSVWGSIFNFFWAIYHKMWIVATFIIMVNFAIILIYDAEKFSMIEYFKYVIQFFIFGFFATELREFYAEKQGMVLDDIILANSEEDAESKYMMRIGDYF